MAQSKEMKELINIMEIIASLRWIVVSHGDATIEEVDEIIRTKGEEYFKEYDPNTLDRASFIFKSLNILLRRTMEQREENTDV